MDKLGKIIGMGGTADVYEYGQGKVVKLYRSQNDVHNADGEYENSVILYQTGFPSPKPFGRVEINNLPGIIFERVEGEPMISTFFSDMENCIKTLVSLLTEFHKINIANTPEIKKLSPLKDKLIGHVRIAAYLTDEEREQIRAYIYTLPDEPVLSHGDFNPTNIMMRNGQPVLIDFVSLALGSPMYDIMQMCTLWKYVVLDERFNESEKIQFDQSRDKINELFISEYDRNSPIDHNELDRWFIPVATERLNKYNNVCEEQKLNLLKALRERLREI